MKLSILAALASVAVVSAAGYKSEYIPKKGQKWFVKSPLPHTYMTPPASLDWGNVNGTSYVTKNLNQHLPQYCGSCWAHGALSALSDRVKIARKAKGVEVNLAVQYILNCGDAGSCHGGSHHAVYEFVKEESAGIPYDTCQPYLACSAESAEGFCQKVDTSCSAFNTCRTCSTFSDMGGVCNEIDYYPNVTIAEYGSVSGENEMMAEIAARGPIACGVNAEPLLQYSGGIFDGQGEAQVNHIISVTGYGEENGKPYWIVRNSWGEYWGEMGYFRIARGSNKLGIESDCAWATPEHWTESNVACYENGANCKTKKTMKTYEDPSKNAKKIKVVRTEA